MADKLQQTPPDPGRQSRFHAAQIFYTAQISYPVQRVLPFLLTVVLYSVLAMMASTLLGLLVWVFAVEHMSYQQRVLFMEWRLYGQWLLSGLLVLAKLMYDYRRRAVAR